ncbi:hypothetical protein DFH09DRAFT_1088404 [Mycena vulgaris]|nr:hypothetical protein DFH09DRAFT_1088404 [Mycena vulgaris]
MYDLTLAQLFFGKDEVEIFIEQSKLELLLLLAECQPCYELLACEKAGLPKGSQGTLQHNAGDAYGQLLGEWIILNHLMEGVFLWHYSRNCGIILVVWLRLGKIPGPNEKYARQILKTLLEGETQMVSDGN